MSIDRVREFFREHGIEDRVVEFEVSSATVALAAQAIGCDEARIAKTLSFIVRGEPIAVVVAGDARVDGHKFKQQFGAKPKMMKHEDTELLIGHAVGGVCPFAVNEGVKVYLDISLRRFEDVYPAAGNDRSMIHMTIEELERLSTPAGWVDVAKLPEQSAEPG